MADCTTIVTKADDDYILSNYNITSGSFVTIDCRGFGKHIDGPSDFECKQGVWLPVPILSCRRILDTRETLLVTVFACSAALLLICLIGLCCACACSKRNYYRNKPRRFNSSKYRGHNPQQPSPPPPYEDDDPPMGVVGRQSGLWGTRTEPEVREYDVRESRDDVSPRVERRVYTTRREEVTYNENQDRHYKHDNVNNNTGQQSPRQLRIEPEFERSDALRRSRHDHYEDNLRPDYMDDDVRQSRHDVIERQQRPRTLQEILDYQEREDEAHRGEYTRERIHRYVEDSRSNLAKSFTEGKPYLGYKKGLLSGNEPIKYNREGLSLDHILYKGRGKVTEIYEDQPYNRSGVPAALVLSDRGYLGVTTRTEWPKHIPRPLLSLSIGTEGDSSDTMDRSSLKDSSSSILTPFWNQCRTCF